MTQREGGESRREDVTAPDVRRVYLYLGIACALTWSLAMPLASAWLRHEAPPPFAVACAGLSAFGPLLSTLLVVARSELRGVFGRWRANPGWVVLSLLAPAAIHVAATALFAASGGQPARWLHSPATPEAFAALLVFPIGEEFGWRGFAHPRLSRHFGLVKGNLILGAMWGLWHLGYSVTPAGDLDPVGFFLGMLELPLYSLLVAWVLERTNRSMAVAIAFHAGAHLDHIEPDRGAGLLLHGFYLAVLAGLATLAVRGLMKLDATRLSAALVPAQASDEAAQ